MVCAGPRRRPLSLVTLEQYADRMGNLPVVFPLIFFLVAALVSFTTMTRMVEEKRLQIGTLKALGYSNAAICRKYCSLRHSRPAHWARRGHWP